MFDTTINWLLWAVVAHPVAFTVSSILIATAMVAFMEALKLFANKPVLAFGTTIPIVGFLVTFSALSTMYGGGHHSIERTLTQNAPSHPALDELAEIRADKDWRGLMYFQSKWDGEIRYGAELLALKSVAADMDAHIADEVIEQVRAGAMPNTQYRQYTRMLLSLGSAQASSDEMATLSRVTGS